MLRQEWWVGGEMLRILLLTSCIGFFGRSCETKVLIAQVIALVFLVVFLLHRPYRNPLHHHAQVFAMLLPLAALAYAGAGGYERASDRLVAAERSHAIDDADKSYDRVALVLLHVALASPVFLSAVFTLGSLLLVSLTTAIAPKPRQDMSGSTVTIGGASIGGAARAL